MDIGNETLTLIEHLYAKRDIDGLMRLHDILATLCLQGIADERTSYVDLSEYVESLAHDLKNDTPARLETLRLRELIDGDLEE